MGDPSTGETASSTASPTTAEPTVTETETETETAGPPEFPIDVQGHRGNRGNVPPGNTLESYRSALELGVTTIEGDMLLTADHAVVMGHDDDLTVTGCVWAGEGEASSFLVSKQMADQVARWDCHPEREGIQAPPPLATVLALDDKVGFNLEFKRTGSEEVDLYLQALFAYNNQCAECLLGRMTIQSFNWGDLKYARTTYSDAVLWGSDGFSVSALGLAPKLDDIEEAAGYAEIWSPHVEIVTPEIIVQVHAFGLRVIPWTVNDAAEMQKMLDLGVDGIITDYPDVLIELFAQN